MEFPPVSSFEVIISVLPPLTILYKGVEVYKVYKGGKLGLLFSIQAAARSTIDISLSVVCLQNTQIY